MNIQKFLRDVKIASESIISIDALSNKRILITGATGLIGSTVATMLSVVNGKHNMNIELVLSGRNEAKLHKRFYGLVEDYEAIEYDIADGFKYDKPLDYIIHCASNAHPLAYSKQPVETLVNNINGTNELLKYSVEWNIKRFLYVSSSEVYGNKNDNCLYTEDKYYDIDILNPRSCYPSSKRAAETLCSAYNREFDIDYVVVRPGHVYGALITENDSRAHAQFLRDAINGNDIVMKSNGMQLRSYCNALDCASALLSVLCAGKNGYAYNISNRESITTIRDFAQAHAAYVGKKILFENPTDQESMGYNMMPNSALNSDKLYDLGWNGKYNLEEGVKEVLDLYLKN
ncbi:MAG: NAD(P)-dependent oxidoreductase [Bacillota bacterium]|nr:NAD(P)-dependent oxidoreductase [Bacillota bacterium]